MARPNGNVVRGAVAEKMTPRRWVVLVRGVDVVLVGGIDGRCWWVLLVGGVDGWFLWVVLMGGVGGWC